MTRVVAMMSMDPEEVEALAGHFDGFIYYLSMRGIHTAGTPPT
jgi:tryptophan synthase alpha subunit